MKHKLVIIAGLCIIVALSIVCVKSYHNDQYLLNLKQRANATIQKRRAAAVQAKHQTVIKQLQDQCHSDHVTYLAMTPADRVKYQAQDCNPSLQLVQ